jgi:WhiB family redox-sensing transcriptional regulator
MIETTPATLATGPAPPALVDPRVAPVELPCRRYDPDLFFAEEPADVEFAKTVCGDCAIRAACLTGALARAEPWGVWGGELLAAGAVVARKRPRGRPRKHARSGVAAA